MNNAIHDVRVLILAAVLALLAFSDQAQAAPPCNHPGYSTPQKCAANSLCKWCVVNSHGFCWWKSRECGKKNLNN